MDVPNNLKYTRSHEWVRLEDESEAVIGITDYAQEELGDIVYVELPEEGERLEQDGVFGVVESVKTTEDLYSPLTGMVIEVNTPLEDAPETVNEDPYGDGWMIRIRISAPEELDDLMSAKEYKEFIAEESE